MSRRPFALARLWDFLTDSWPVRFARLGLGRRSRRPIPVVPFHNQRLAALPLEDRVTPDSRPLPNPLLFVGGGTGAPPVARAYRADTGVLAFEKTPFDAAFAGGVRVAAGDLNIDGWPDLICAAGPGGGPRVVVYDGKTGDQLTGPLGSFFAYDPGFAGGVYVAAGDCDGDGAPDLITAAGAGGGPHVKAFSGATGAEILSFFAFAPEFQGGATVMAAEFTGDARVDLAVGAGPGGGPHVKVFDLSTQKVIPGKLGSFMAYDPSFTGGVSVGTDWQTGDVSGDGRHDLVVGAGAGGGPHVKVYDGKTGAVVRDFLAFDPTMTAGVRVASAFVSDDSYADIVVGTGAGVAATVRVFDGQTLAELPAPMSPYQPFGASYAGGVYVAASNDPVVTSGHVDSQFGSAVVGQTLAFQATIQKVGGNPTPTGTVTFSSNPGGIILGTVGLSADPGGDAVAGIIIPASQFDGGYGGAGVNIAYSGDSVYANYGAFAGRYVSFSAGMMPGCDPCAGQVTTGAGGTPPGPTKTAGGVGLDGAVVVSRTALTGQTGSAADFASDNAGAFGMSSGQQGKLNATAAVDDEVALYRNNADGTAGVNGSSLALFANGSAVAFFDKYSPYGSWPLPAATFHPRTGDGSGYTVAEDGTNAQIVVTDGAGTTFIFWDFSSGNGGKAGRLQKKTSPDGSYYEVTSWDGSGKPAETQTVVGSGGTAITESVTYSTTSGVRTATLRRKVGTGSWATVRTSDTAALNGGGYGGSVGETQTVKDASGNVLDTTYFRFEVSSGSSTGRVKFALGPAAYARLVAALGTGVASLTDSQISPYADQYYEYDSTGRCTKAVLAGAGCSACTGGQGEYTYAYTERSPQHTWKANCWVRKVAETQPDGSTNTYYLDSQNRVMLKAHANGSSTWRWVYQYDDWGRLVREAEPSAVSGHSESADDLVDADAYYGGPYLRSGEGLIRTYTYGATTTATTSAAGDVWLHLKGTAVRRGTGGTDVSQSATTYIARTAGGVTTYHPASDTRYRNDNGTGGQTTSYAYTWLGSTHQPASVTTTLPTVTTAQNGPNTAASSTTVFDAQGRVQWTKDAAGVLGYTQYDAATGSVVKTIADVNTANTSDFADLPSGWSTPSGAGLHLIATFEADALGRTTKTTDPLGHVAYTVYTDTSYEVRTYSGWNTSTSAPTGPTYLTREDRANGYTESLTMSATPSVSSGRPTGTESISGIQSLSRTYRNTAGQTTHADSYFDLTGVTYSTAANIGTLNTHYHRTTTGYGSAGGQANKTVSAAGTITRTEYDTLGRAVSVWAGTDDTPTTGFWSPTNLTGTDMVKVGETEYDGGGVGDGNVTKSTAYPGGSAAARVSQTWYDWRNRAVGSKGGVETSESTSVNRPLSYAEYDNLGQTIYSEMYDGDGVSLTDGNSDGVPDRPSSSLLRAKSKATYDELGRAYKTETYSVDPSSGSVSSDALTSQVWFDLRGLTLKTTAPGGLVQKTAYDSLGRATTTYVTDGGGDSGYADADDVTGDTVLSQQEVTYDANGNVLLTVTRERFHDAYGTGGLGHPTSGPSVPTARVSYAATYYDLLDRATDTVSVGTNAGSSWTRPSSVPSRSDTVLVSSVVYDSAGRSWKTTDPRALESRTTYDLAGRVVKTVENYVDGTVSDADDKTTEYAYGPAGRTSLTAKLTGGGGQTTEWVYGVTTGGGSGLTSNDIVGATKWPDPSTGASSSGQQETVLVNALGQPLVTTDRNGNTHTLTYDILGRVVSDAVTTLGSGVDGAVRRVETAYDSQGNAYLTTSYDAASGGSIVTQVQRAYNGLGQLTAEYQSHSGAVNTSTTPKVQYAYSTLDSNNRSRLTSVTYPSGYVLTHNYSSGLNGSISRLSSLSDTSGTVESYDYLGLGTVVIRGHSQPGVDLTYLKLSGESAADAGDQYTGLDRFTRVADQRWRTSSADVERTLYGYDRTGNRVSRTNSVNSTYSEAYTYDGLNQLSTFNRNSGARTQSWDYDALGNWDGVTTNGSTQTRTHNKQNEITAVSGATTPTFDANGNMTTDETGLQYVYDAWNRLTAVKSSGGTTLKTYTYDALNRRVAETASGTITDLYYSAGWQVLEEAVGGTTKARYVWSPVYVDALILRDRDTDANGTLDERLWVIQDANFNVVALVNGSGTVVEQYAYDSFGAVTVLNGSWTVIGASAYGWVYLHQGTRRDGVSGLDDHRERWYSPTLGRWVSMDPISYQAGDVNLYRFVNNSPMCGLDPQGLADKTPAQLRVKSHTPAPPNATFQGPIYPVAYGSYGAFYWAIDWDVSHAQGENDCTGVIIQLVNTEASDNALTVVLNAGKSKAERVPLKGLYYAEAWSVVRGPTITPRPNHTEYLRGANLLGNDKSVRAHDIFTYDGNKGVKNGWIEFSSEAIYVNGDSTAMSWLRKNKFVKNAAHAGAGGLNGLNLKNGENEKEFTNLKEELGRLYNRNPERVSNVIKRSIKVEWNSNKSDGKSTSSTGAQIESISYLNSKFK